MVVVRNISSDLFDEAYFIMKDGEGNSDVFGDEDMISEASRILAASTGQPYEANARCSSRALRRKRLLYGLLAFSSGMLFGGAVSFLIVLLR